MTDLSPNNLQRIEAAAKSFAQRLRAEPSAREHQVPDFVELAAAQGALGKPAHWWNVLVETPILRHAHVEYFAIAGQIAVLHVCCFGRRDFALPIFGFDVIAGAARATGAFLDLSPIDAASSAMSAQWAQTFANQRTAFKQERDLPDWGAIFSPHMLAVRPQTEAEIEAALDLGAQSFEWFLRTPPTPAADPAAISRGQANYVAGQRRNEHTLRMLTQVVGPALASRFLNEYLFPAAA